jgi:hypothetical protein
MVGIERRLTVFVPCAGSETNQIVFPRVIAEPLRRLTEIGCDGYQCFWRDSKQIGLPPAHNIIANFESLLAKSHRSERWSLDRGRSEHSIIDPLIYIVRKTLKNSGKEGF